jgi:hypothetical protein
MDRATVLDKTTTKPQPNKAAERYASVINAVRAREAAVHQWERGLWLIGDQLIAACGPPGRRGVNDQSHRIMREIASELGRLGFKSYGTEMLRKLRQVASAFEDGKRLPSVTWDAYHEARDQKTFDVAMQYARTHGVELTAAIVKRYKEDGKRSDLSAALRAKDDCIVLINDTAAALAHLQPHIPHLIDVDREELQEALDELISTATDVKEALAGEVLKEAAE